MQRTSLFSERLKGWFRLSYTLDVKTPKVGSDSVFNVQLTFNMKRIDYINSFIGCGGGSSPTTSHRISPFRRTKITYAYSRTLNSQPLHLLLKYVLPTRELLHNPMTMLNNKVIGEIRNSFGWENYVTRVQNYKMTLASKITFSSITVVIIHINNV